MNVIGLRTRASPKARYGRHSLERLAHLPEAQVAEPLRHSPASTPLPTGEWGRPARPEPGDASGQPRRARFQIRRFFPPPPPPPTVDPSLAPPLTRRRFRSIAVELAVAAVVIASVSSLAGGSSASPVPDGAEALWNARALPALALLVGDLTGLQADASAGGESAGSRSPLAQDTVRLEHDLQSAGALPPPPSRSLRQQWSAALLRLGAVVAQSQRLTSVDATPGGRQEAIAGLEAAVGQAGQSLLDLAASIR